MKIKLWTFAHYARQSALIRSILSPVFNTKKRIIKRRYLKSEDCKKLASFYNKHLGERCYIIGNGPSLCAKDLDLISEEKSFACNRIYSIYDQTNWRPTYYMCMDAAVYSTGVKDNYFKLKDSVKFIANFCYKYGIPDKTSTIKVIKPNKVISHVEAFKKTRASKDVSQGFSEAISVVQSLIELALYMGFKDIILLGVDHNFPVIKNAQGKIIVNDQNAGHFEGAGSPNRKLDLCYFDASTSCYEYLNVFANSKGATIRNATPGSKLNVYEKVSLLSVLSEDRSS